MATEYKLPFTASEISEKLTMVDELSEEKANITYVDGQIAKAQLEGAGVDTSQFVTQDDLKNINAGLTDAQISALDEMFKVCAYTQSDVSTQYNAFKTAFGLTESSGGNSGSDEETGGDTETTIYTITNTLTNVTNDNSKTSVDENSSYTAILTASDGYTLDTVTVTMGGTDVTSTVYSDGSINIDSVTGNIVITASAIEEVVEDIVVYNVFDGTFTNTGYSGDRQTQFGSNYNVYEEKIDVTNADTLYYRAGVNNRTNVHDTGSFEIGIYASDDTFIQMIALNSVAVKVESEQDHTNGLEALDNGETLYTKAVCSVDLSSYENRAYVLFAVRPSTSLIEEWSGNAQSTSLLTLEGEYETV